MHELSDDGTVPPILLLLTALHHRQSMHAQPDDQAMREGACGWRTGTQGPSAPKIPLEARRRARSR
jgi:hypothetical protein